MIYEALYSLIPFNMDKTFLTVISYGQNQGCRKTGAKGAAVPKENFRCSPPTFWFLGVSSVHCQVSNVQCVDMSPTLTGAENKRHREKGNGQHSCNRGTLSTRYTEDF